MIAKKPYQKADNSYLFKCLILANFLQYLEAGAVPALLLELSDSFNMGSGSQGLLGGIVYVSLSVGSPVAGYLLRTYEHKTVICSAVAANMFFTFLWAMTPVGRPYSTNLFIFLRFLMGLCQCVLCVFLPLWTNEYAPRDKKTSWMSYLQASVPFGVMMGYIIASLLLTFSRHSDRCLDLLCWRWAFLIEIMLLTPLYLGLYFIPREDIQVDIHRKAGRGTAIGGSGGDREYGASGDSTAGATNECDQSTAQTTELGEDAPAPPYSAVVDEVAWLPAEDDDEEAGAGAEASKSRSASKRTHNGRISSQNMLPFSPGKIEEDRDKDERRRRSSLRKGAMSASMYDSMSTRYAFKKSSDNIALLDPEEDMFHALPGFRWSSRSSKQQELLVETNQSPLPISSDGAKNFRDVEGEYGTTTVDDSYSKLSSSSNSNEPQQGMEENDTRIGINNTCTEGSPPRESKRLSFQDWFFGSTADNNYDNKRNAMSSAEYSNPDEGNNNNSNSNSNNNADEYTALTPSKMCKPVDSARHTTGSKYAEDVQMNINNSYGSMGLSNNEGGGSNRPLVRDVHAPPLNHHCGGEVGELEEEEEEVQYESFKDMTNSTVSNRLSWDVFSLWSYSGSNNRSRTNSESAGISNSHNGIHNAHSNGRCNRHSSGTGSGQGFHSSTSEDQMCTTGTGSSSGGPTSTRGNDAMSGRKIRSRSLGQVECRREGGAPVENPLHEDAQQPLQERQQQDQQQEQPHLVQPADFTSSRRRSYFFSSRRDDDALAGQDGYISYTPTDSDSDEEWAELSSKSHRMSSSSSSSSSFATTSATKDPPWLSRAHQEGEGGGGGGGIIASYRVVECTQRVVWKAYRHSRSVYDSVAALLSIKTYRYLLAAMSGLYFTVTGVQYWGTKYMTIALHSPLPLVNLMFILVAATGPTLGVFFGGYIIDLCGGYKGAHQRVVALEMCSTFGIMSCLFSVPVTFVENIYVVAGLLWMVLFFGGSMLPACSGIIVSIIPRSYRPTSSSLALVVFNMFGYSFSLLLSGYLMEILELQSGCEMVCAMTWGFRLVLFWSFLSVFFLIQALLASYQHLRDRDRGHRRGGRSLPAATAATIPAGTIGAL
mmetsp:Transcript_25537/g.42813  ORF Transcript_25537/g.42813 Transcript_25537/m.42813 type:complete len:1106 (-) Transcript_25537:8-3325(-)